MSIQPPSRDAESSSGTGSSPELVAAVGTDSPDQSPRHSEIAGSSANRPSASAGNEPLTLSSVLLTMLTVVLWAGTPVAIRFSTDMIPPVAVAGLRFAMAAVFMAVWARWHGTSLKVSGREMLKPAICGVMLFLQIGLFTIGVGWSNGSHGSIFINTYIFWIVAIDHFVTADHRLDLRRLLGLLMAAAGVGLILLTTQGHKSAAQPEAASLDGDILLLISAALLAVKISYTRRSVRTVHPDAFIFWHAVWGVVLFAAWSFTIERFRFEQISDLSDARIRNGLWGIAYQGIAVAGLCFAIQARLLKKHAASKIAVFSFATPLFGILFSVLLRGDPLSPWLFVAGACVASGILLVNQKQT